MRINSFERSPWVYSFQRALLIGLAIGAGAWLGSGHYALEDLIAGVVAVAVFAPFMRYVAGPRLRMRRDQLFPEGEGP
jgi:hypothetical protein